MVVYRQDIVEMAKKVGVWELWGKYYCCNTLFFLLKLKIK